MGKNHKCNLEIFVRKSLQGEISGGIGGERKNLEQVWTTKQIWCRCIRFDNQGVWRYSKDE